MTDIAVVVYLDNVTRMLIYTLERSTELPSESCHLLNKICDQWL